MATLGSNPTLYVGGKIQQHPVLLKVNLIQVVKPQFHPIIKGIIGRLKIRLIEDQEKKIKLYSIAWSFIPRGNDTNFIVVLLVRFGALAEIGAYQVCLGYDSEPERTLLRRRREARRVRQAELKQELNMAANNEDDLNTDNNHVTLGQYINPTADSCGSTIRRPAIQAFINSVGATRPLQWKLP
ncbi:hypothetical protein PIB30_082687 [Stylosanthes scabra]|uniref:Uncharacterized protein n=1 Tax=Stylosanthes scabra TaxID=79078 RepID=A0ABU6ZQM4_9FABA|nr:hypothetical protein [Stylosanthes scabra]